MTSWVYLFSKFTPEALLFEALVIFLLCSGYAAFWILKKRRFGVVETTMPAGPVKAYLNDLIVDAEQLRAQLFGLLGHPQSSVKSSSTFSLPSISVEADPNLVEKLSLLEAKMAEQMKSLEQISIEKAQLEKDLAAAKATVGTASNKGEKLRDEVEMNKLHQKVKNLETRLAEYSVIEDDLANLKRFQQENALLKQTLTSKGIAVPDLNGGEGAPAEGNPAASAPPAEAAAEAPKEPAAPASPEPAASEPPSNEPPPEAPAAAAAPSPAKAPAAKAAPAAKDPTVPEGSPVVPEPNVPSPNPAGNEPTKSEEDLVAEFEKMLKG